MRRSIKQMLFPVHWMIPLGFTLFMNTVAYNGVRVLADGKDHFNLSGPLDDLVPFMPEFIIVYFGCYLFWIVNYVWIARGEKEEVYRFFTADFYARLVCGLVFFFFPTTNTRPVLCGNDFWTDAVRFLYMVDAPTNLLPSIHCMTSWFCYLGIRKRPDIPKWYKSFSMITAVAVFVSTLALRQHVLADVVTGVLLAEVTYYISQHTDGYKVYMRIAERLGDRLTERIEGLEYGEQEKDGI